MVPGTSVAAAAVAGDEDEDAAAAAMHRAAGRPASAAALLAMAAAALGQDDGRVSIEGVAWVGCGRKDDIEYEEGAGNDEERKRNACIFLSVVVLGPQGRRR
jgi:hypothetical protein